MLRSTGAWTQGFLSNDELDAPMPGRMGVMTLRRRSIQDVLTGWSLAYWLIAVGVVGGWWLLATGVVPDQIRAVHAGGGPSFLQAAMSQAGDRPLAGYIETWHRVTTTTTFYLATAFLILYVLIRYVKAVRNQAGRPPVEGGEHGVDGLSARTVPAWAPLAVAVWFGLLGGAGESYYALAKVYLLAESVPRFAPTNVGLAAAAPWVNAAILGLLALPLSLLARRGRLSRNVTLGVLAAACFLTLLSWVRLPERASLVPAAILALGITVQVVRSGRSRLADLAFYTRRSAPAE